MSDSNRFGSVCGKQDARLKFVKQNEGQFRLCKGPIDTVEVTRCSLDMAQVWGGARHEIGGSCPAPRVPHLYVPALMSTSMNSAASIAV